MSEVPPEWPPTPVAPARETPKQRRDRELIELLNELRLATPGVQLVFGFLLIVPFNERFADTTDFQRGLYVLSLVLTAVATILLIGASVQHRLLFRRHFEKRMLPVANRISLVGLTCLGLGMISALLFVTHFVFGAVAATVIGTLVGLLMVSVWYALPLVRARAAERSAEDDE
jgi:hypothetical protein